MKLPHWIKTQTWIIWVLAYIAVVYLVWNRFRYYSTEEGMFWVSVLSSLSVFIAIITAIYGDRIKSLYQNSKLSIQKPDFENNFLDSDNKTYCHHLAAVNESHFGGVKNCQVWITKVTEIINDVEENKFRFAVPRILCWAPAEYNPLLRDIYGREIIDLGVTNIASETFIISAPQGGYFEPKINKGQHKKLYVKIVGEGYVNTKDFIVDINYKDTTELKPINDEETKNLPTITVSPPTPRFSRSTEFPVPPTWGRRLSPFFQKVY